MHASVGRAARLPPARSVPLVRRACRRAAAVAPSSAAGDASPPATWRHLDLHVGPTTVRVPMPPDRVAALRGELATLLATFKDKADAARPRRWPSMDVVWKGGATGTPSITRFEVFCNPNGATGPFDARVLVTVETADGVAVTTEAPLAALRADVDAYGGV